MALTPEGGLLDVPARSSQGSGVDLHQPLRSQGNDDVTLGNAGASSNVDPLDLNFGDVRQPYGGLKDFEQAGGTIIRNPDLQVIGPGQTALPLQKGTRYIWAIDNEGNLRIGTETPVSQGRRLGHPSLVPETGAARVGGEIKFNEKTKQWRINDRSGRFSRGRSAEQRATILNNV